MERKTKIRLKKIISVLCILVMLQNYISCFAQIVWAISEEINVEDVLGTSSNEELIINNQQDSENTANIENQSKDSLDEKENEEEQILPENSVENTNENSEEEITGENNEISEENPVEETQSEENLQEEQKEQKEEITEEVVEPYVEPEVAIEVKSENSNIYKGYLYANAVSDFNYATDYNTISSVTITGGKNMNSLTVQDEPDKIGLITNTKIGLISQMYYRQTRISVEEFNNILGQDGSITLYSPENEIIGYINKDTVQNNGEYVFTYETQMNSIKFEFVNIKNDGVISIKNDKAIKGSAKFSRNQISLFSNINTISAVNAYCGEVVKEEKAEGNITLEETESKMLIDVDTDVLSVEKENEVAINVTLKTDEERYDLFENPEIEIEFPSQVKEVEVTGITLLYKNGLSIKNWEVVTNTLGKKVIKIKLDGAQLEYMPGSVQEGTTVVLYTNINVDRLTADTNEVLKLTYSNKDTVRKSYVLEGKDSEDINVSFVGRQELVRTMELKGEEIETAVSYDNEIKQSQIKVNKNQTVDITGSILNNYSATLTDVEIVGRIPFVGNKDEKGNDLGTNFDTNFKNKIVTSGVLADIYYSEDEKAEVNGDSWVSDVTDISKYKSFKIVVKEKTLAKGEKLSFEYSLEIPETVSYNSKAYANFTTYYKIDTQKYFNDCMVGMYTEEKEIDMEDIKEEEKEKTATLTIGTQVSQGGVILGQTDTVYERQVLKYTVVVKNTSKVTAENVVVRGNAENANLYTWVYSEIATFEGKVREMQEIVDGSKEYEEFIIDKLLPGESRTIEYQVIVKKGAKEVFGNIIVNANGMEEKQITTFKTNVLEAEIETLISRASTQSENEKDNTSMSTYKYIIKIKNLKDEDLNNVKAYINFPNEFSFSLSDVNYARTSQNYDEIKMELKENNNLVLDIKKLYANEEIEMLLFITIKDFDKNISYISVSMTAICETENQKYSSNNLIEKIYQGKTGVEYTWTADQTKEELNDGDELTYTLNLKNTGMIDIYYTDIIDELPSGLKIKDIILKDSDGTRQIQFNEYDKKITISVSNIKSGEELILNVKTVVNENLFERDQKIIENRLNVDGGAYYEKFNTNIITYKINNTTNITKYATEVPKEPEKNDNYNNSSNNNSNNQVQENNNQNNSEQNNNININKDQKTTEKIQTFHISGLAWIDNNQDGIRQSEESPKESVVVQLFKANNNGGIDTTKLIDTTSTNNEGRYTFSNVENGKYVIVFDYDSNKYKVTKYQVETATSTENSDAISKKLTLNGETRVFAVTDVLEVNNIGLISIDIGLVDTTNFDLKLEKTISTIKVKNDEGTKLYNYNNTSNAKIEIRSKYYKSSVLDVTYKFKITNEGEVSGYVNKIVDYLPEGMAVNLNASPDWYIGSDNGLYYTGLLDKEIKPGETKEFELVLRKSLEDGESLKLINSAEIVETTNSLGLFDKDSIENNKMKTEDDYSEAILMVSISTGNSGSYIIIVLVIIIMIAVIVYVIIKLKKIKKIYK